MQNEFDWTRKATRMMSDEVSLDNLPKRAAITGVGVITIKRADVTSLLLCNPHASSWNNWLLPYGSLIESFSPDELTIPRTFGRLAEKLDTMSVDNHSEYTEQVFGAITQMLGLNELQFE